MSVPSLRDFLGRSESDDLEFKGRAAVDDPRSLPRSVCAMLNSGGGRVLVGLGDDGRTVEPIDDAERARRRVLDRLASTITPSLPQGLRIDVLEEGPILMITVPAPEERRLFAVRSTEGRFFVPSRTGDRTQLMDWTEILHRLASPAPPERAGAEWPREVARGLLEEWRGQCAERGIDVLDRLGGLFVVFAAAPADGRDRRDQSERVLRAALLDPASLGIRREGWHFSSRIPMGVGAAALTRRREGWIVSGDLEEAFRRIEVRADPDLCLRFLTRLDGGMRIARDHLEEPSDQVLHPLALSESVSSCAQLYRELLVRTECRPARVGAAMALTRTKGLLLPPHRPGPLGLVDPLLWPKAQEASEVVLQEEIAFGEFREHPHRLARLLLLDVYRHFGHDDGAMPFWVEAEQRFSYR